ncbi:MAG: fumarylacetoacetate hydrolase family protein, partial [Gemmatimonadales bacterium]|nr:fumarylacetoacetate hydrolase family protein [Gemmatimonadales bacterium]
MKLFKTSSGPVLETGGAYAELPFEWDELVNRQGLRRYLELLQAERRHTGVHALGDVLAPIGRQEVWAAGVTYQRSRTARMDESTRTGASSFYDKVYEAERPELFFKAVAQRVSGPGQPIRIRKDSTWDVPEPELTLFVCSQGTIEGYTIGNDVSSRSIEGENPLYLPQAKVFDGSTALGPCLCVPPSSPDGQTEITMEIVRNGASVYR